MNNILIRIITTVFFIAFITTFNYGGCGGGGGSSGGGSAPQQPPTVTTNSATDITIDSAILNGTVNPNGISTSACFKYGISSSNDNSTISKPLGAGTSDVVVTDTVTGLLAETQYKFKLVASNSLGIFSGTELSFTTQTPTEPPDQVTFPNPADESNDVSVTTQLSWAPASGASFYDVYFGTDANPPCVSADIIQRSYAPTLSYNTTYYWRIDSKNVITITTGNIWSFTTQPLPPPTCTTNAASNITSNSARLNGTVNPNGFDTTAYFEYGISTTPITYLNNTTPQIIGSGTANLAVNADISGLSSNTVYNFRCVATSAGGTRYGTNRTFGRWSATTFTSGIFTNTQTANSDNDVIISKRLNWIQRYSITGTPSARYGHTMVYDSARQRMVLFGGGAYGSDETWEWDGTEWVQFTPALAPSLRSYHSMAYDSIRQVTVLFGEINPETKCRDESSIGPTGVGKTVRSIDERR